MRSVLPRLPCRRLPTPRAGRGSGRRGRAFGVLQLGWTVASSTARGTITAYPGTLDCTPMTRRRVVRQRDVLVEARDDRGRLSTPTVRARGVRSVRPSRSGSRLSPGRARRRTYPRSLARPRTSLRSRRRLARRPPVREVSAADEPQRQSPASSSVTAHRVAMPSGDPLSRAPFGRRGSREWRSTTASRPALARPSAPDYRRYWRRLSTCPRWPIRALPPPVPRCDRPVASRASRPVASPAVDEPRGSCRRERHDARRGDALRLTGRNRPARRVSLSSAAAGNLRPVARHGGPWVDSRRSCARAWRSSAARAGASRWPAALARSRRPRCSARARGVIPGEEATYVLHVLEVPSGRLAMQAARSRTATAGRPRGSRR